MNLFAGLFALDVPANASALFSNNSNYRASAQPRTVDAAPPVAVPSRKRRAASDVEQPPASSEPSRAKAKQTGSEAGAAAASAPKATKGSKKAATETLQPEVDKSPALLQKSKKPHNLNGNSKVHTVTAPHGKEGPVPGSPAHTAHISHISLQQQQQQLQQQQLQQQQLQQQQPPNTALEGADRAVQAKRGANSKPADYSDDEEPAQPAAAAKPKLDPAEQAERLSRTLFVGNVPADTPPKLLKALFAKFGTVASARLRCVPLVRDAKMPRKGAIITGKVDAARAPAVAYVMFQEASSMEAVLKADCTQLKLGEHQLRVDRASAPSKQQAAGEAGPRGTLFDHTRCLFIGNLSFHVTDDELAAFFSRPEALEGCPELAPAAHGGQSAVESVRVVRDPATALGKGFAYVLFRTKAAARAALSLNGQVFKKRALRITRDSVQIHNRHLMERAAAKSKAAPKTGPARGSDRPVASRPIRPSSGAPSGGGRGPRQLGSALASQPELWQGTKTKGKDKGVRGSKVMGTKTLTGTGGVTKLKGQAKRPAVAARKAALLKAATPGGASVKKPHSHTAAASSGAHNSFKVKRITPRHL